jgi:hypothetical protein
VPDQNTAWFICFQLEILLSSRCFQLAVDPTFCVAVLVSTRVHSDTRQTNARADYRSNSVTNRVI